MFLDTVARPLVVFDPSNKEHRSHYSKFLKENTWGHCPVRFAVPGFSSDNNLAYAMQRMLVEYYVNSEFK